MNRDLPVDPNSPVAMLACPTKRQFCAKRQTCDGPMSWYWTERISSASAGSPYSYTTEILGMDVVLVAQIWGETPRMVSLTASTIRTVGQMGLFSMRAFAECEEDVLPAQPLPKGVMVRVPVVVLTLSTSMSSEPSTSTSPRDICPASLTARVRSDVPIGAVR